MTCIDTLVQRFRKGRGIGISTLTQSTGTLVVLSETDRVQCLVDRTVGTDFSLQWTLLIPSGKKLTCHVIALRGVQFLGVLDERDITLWDPNTEEFGVVSGKSVVQVPYFVQSLVELALSSKSYILVILSDGYQIVEPARWEILFSFELNNCRHICSQVVHKSVASASFPSENDYFIVLGVIVRGLQEIDKDNKKGSRETLFMHIFNEECCKVKSFEWNVKPPVETSTIQSFIFYQEQQSDESCFTLCILWSSGVLEFRMIAFSNEEPIVLRRVTLWDNQSIQNVFLMDWNSDYFALVFKDNLQVWHKKWKFCLESLTILKELGVAKNTSLSPCSHLGENHFCIYGCFVNGLTKWICEFPQLSLSQIIEMKGMSSWNTQDRSRKGQIFSEDFLKVLSISDNNSSNNEESNKFAEGMVEALWEKEKEWISYIEQGLYSSKDILSILQNPPLPSVLEHSSTSQHPRFYEKPSTFLINTILTCIMKALKDGDFSYAAVLEFLVQRHWIDYSTLRNSWSLSGEGHLHSTKNPILFPFLWKNRLYSLCLECMKHIVDLPAVEIIYLIQQASSSYDPMQHDAVLVEKGTFHLEQLFNLLWQRPLSTKDMIYSLEMLPLRDVILQLDLFEKELESVACSKRCISKAWIAWIALLLDTNMFALIMDNNGVEYLTRIYDKVKQLEQLNEIVVSMEPLVRSFVEKQQLVVGSSTKRRTHWIEYYSFAI